jgi:homocysteine S-methyltransferase
MTSPMSPLPVEGEVLLLDGGSATTLAERGHDLDGPLWSARLLLEDPDAVRAMHRDFLDAGARVLLTVSYQLSGEGLERLGVPASRTGELMARSVALARRAAERAEEAEEGVQHAVDRAAGQVGGRAAEESVEQGGALPRGATTEALVAGSLGPFGALLADGSEYRGRYGVGAARLRDVHAPRLAALLAAEPDLLALETVPSGAEVAVLVELLDGAATPAWVTMTVGDDGTRTPEGEPLEEALGPAIEATEVVAVGVNCLAPELVPAALHRLGNVGMPLVAKPNAGRRWDARARRWRPGGAADPGPWLAAGARLVGGCCGTAPADLRELADRVHGRAG